MSAKASIIELVPYIKYERNINLFKFIFCFKQQVQRNQIKYKLTSNWIKDEYIRIGWKFFYSIIEDTGYAVSDIIGLEYCKFWKKPGAPRERREAVVIWLYMNRCDSIVETVHIKFKKYREDYKKIEIYAFKLPSTMSTEESKVKEPKAKDVIRRSAYMAGYLNMQFFTKETLPNPTHFEIWSHWWSIGFDDKISGETSRFTKWKTDN